MGKCEAAGDTIPPLACVRKPLPSDGMHMWRLAGASPPLEQNTCYAYMLLSRHFSKTCVIAESDGSPIGYVAAYSPPDSPSILFVWQIAVHGSARGMGLAKRMLGELLNRPSCSQVQYIETSVTQSNAASQRMFRSFARDLGCACDESEFMRATDFGDLPHEEEVLLRIGPIPHPAVCSAQNLNRKGKWAQ